MNPDLLAARGVCLGLVIAVVGFWLPLAAVVIL